MSSTGDTASSLTCRYAALSNSNTQQPFVSRAVTRFLESKPHKMESVLWDRCMADLFWSPSKHVDGKMKWIVRDRFTVLWGWKIKDPKMAVRQDLQALWSHSDPEVASLCSAAGWLNETSHFKAAVWKLEKTPTAASRSWWCQPVFNFQYWTKSWPLFSYFLKSRKWIICLCVPRPLMKL